MANDISLTDQRMIELMVYAVSNGMTKNESTYWAEIGFPRTALSMIRNGTQSFRVPYIIAACNLTGASADWVLGLSNEMFRTDERKPTLQVLKEIIAEMEGPHPRNQKWRDKQLVKSLA